MVAWALDSPLLWPALLRDAASRGAQGSAEGELSRAVRAGDPEAFGRLVAQHERAVYALCLRWLGQPEEARDAAQEAFVRAFESRRSYDSALAFRPWLLRIARNHCLDLRRRARIRPEAPGLDAEADAPDRAALAADEGIERAQGQARLRAALARLPAEQREALVLFHQDELSYREIAAVLDVPLGTVMTWLHRARRRLRDELGGEP
ncbi:MAG: RNA polymerase sigma factor [Myxococcales bacterium]